MARLKKLEKLYKPTYFRLQGLLFSSSTESIRRMVETHINFALEKNKSFDLLFSRKQYSSAQSLVRMLAECCLRAYGHLYADSRETFRVVNKSVRGISLQKISASGCKLTDAVLRERIKDVYPIVSLCYKESNANVHVDDYYYEGYLEVVPEELHSRMMALNEVLLEILSKIILQVYRYFPFSYDVSGQDMVSSSLVINILGADAVDEFNAVGWLSLASIKRYILDTELQFSSLYKHHIQKAQSLGYDKKDVLNIIMRPICEEIYRCAGYAKMIASVEEKYGEEAVAGYRATWMKIRIENTPIVGNEITRIEPIWEISEMVAKWDSSMQELGAKILQDIKDNPDRYPAEFIKAVIKQGEEVK